LYNPKKDILKEPSNNKGSKTMLVDLNKLREHVSYNMWNNGIKPKLMYWHYATRKPVYGDTNQDVKNQMRYIKKTINNKWKIVVPNLCVTRCFEDDEWHSLVFQQTDEEGIPSQEKNSPCVLTIGLFNCHVCGEIYWFKEKENRDLMLEHFKKHQNKVFKKQIVDTSVMC